jgi:hypothetical protein
MFIFWWVILGIFGAVLMTAKDKFFPMQNKKIPGYFLVCLRVIQAVLGGGFYLFLVFVEWYFGPSWET